MLALREPSPIIHAMPDRLDVDLSLLNVAAGRPSPDEPPGYALFAAPRRAARGRERDTLLLCLSLRARAALPADRYTDLLHLAAATYFGSPGSVTAAARQAIAAVNQRLLEGNLKDGAPRSGEGEPLRASRAQTSFAPAPVQGGLVCAALRGKELYAVQCGPGSMVVAHAQASERFPAANGRPLGVSDALDAHYFHTTVAEGEYVALSANANWNEAGLIGLGGLATLSAAAERLRAAAGQDFTAMLARFEPGGTQALAPQPDVEADAAAEEKPKPAIALPSVGLPSLSELAARLRPPAPAARPLAERGFRPDLTRPSAEPEPVGMQPEVEATNGHPAGNGHPAANGSPFGSPAAAESPVEESFARDAESVPAESGGPAPFSIEEEAEEYDEPQPFRRETTTLDLSGVALSARRGLRSFGRAVGVSLTELARAMRRLMARTLPEGMLQREGMLHIPTSAQIAIAILIPVLIVALAVILYVQRGQQEQFTEAVLEAKKEITVARTQTVAVAGLPHWESALGWIERAERFRPNDAQLPPLRQEAQTQLDALNWTQRVAYQPLLPNGVGPDSRLTQLTLLGRDVYALDSKQNRVWRFTATSPDAYALDQNFACASGTYGDVTIGPLVDLGHIAGPIDAISAQPNVPNPNADAVIALDDRGKLIYCTIGSRALVAPLPPPAVGFSQPVRMELFANNLYVLDVGQNQLWQFPMQGGGFDDSPIPYFSSTVYDLSDVVDFTIGGGTVFLLRADGRLSRCTRAPILDTTACDENAPFLDERPGRSAGPRLADLSRPAGIFSDQPQEPSVWVINPDNAGLYQLSHKLRYTKQYQPLFPLPQPLTAQAMDSFRVFVAAGNNVYVANRP
jgi:hypothetical protein